MISYRGQVFRMVSAGADATQPVSSPEGRFHHDQQAAIYTSLSPHGTAVAIKRYLGDPATRFIVPLEVDLRRVTDLRGQLEASIVWQDLRVQNDNVPTWQMSDAARQNGADGMLYSSRTRTELTHLVIFAPNCVLSAGVPMEAAPFIAALDT